MLTARRGGARGRAALEIEFADGRLRARPERPPAPRRPDPGPEQGSLL